MASVIDIPAANRATNVQDVGTPSPGSPSSSVQTPNPDSVSYSSSPAHPQTPGPKLPQKAANVPKKKPTHERRTSLLGPAVDVESTHVINIADANSPPRLITYVTASQGFQWNPEIFVPSYLDHEYTPLDNQREPVIEIHITDEEAKAMLPY